MKNKLISFLESVKKSTITLSELEQKTDASDTYDDFAAVVFTLLDEGYINPVKSHGLNWKGLPHTFRIQKGKVMQSLIDSIQQLQFKVHPAIQLRAYLSTSEKKWVEDEPWILKIDEYLKTNGLPTADTNSSERSYELVKDEKWMDEKGGKALLERIHLFDKLKIVKTPDPLMFSLNPQRIAFNQKVHKHLIVENKATYYGLIDSLASTSCTTLIFGSGWKIVSSLRQLAQQVGLTKNEHQHEIYYFGDLDYEGISIYYYLYEKYDVKLAIEFYQALLEKSFYKGKDHQTRNEEAIKHFLLHFTEEEQEKLVDLFQEKGYYPQEALVKDELQHIWRKTTWA